MLPFCLDQRPFTSGCSSAVSGEPLVDAGTMSSEVSTLYIKNLNERINYRRVQVELRKLFESYGPIASIRTGRGIKKRGQAFVAFKDSKDAMIALDNLANHELFLKPMTVALATSNSDSLRSAEDIVANKLARDKKKAADSNDPETDPQSNAVSSKLVKDIKSFGEPHNVLLLQHIPDAITLDDLKAICQTFAGFKEARMFAVKHVGFVEFETVETASAAIDDLSQKRIGDITFAKK